MFNYQISASILSADFAHLGQEVTDVLAAGADMIHFDVMDNHYVPNLTIGALICEALREYGITAPIDVHLMVKPVDRLIKDFAAAGATYISIHEDATDNLAKSLQLIHDCGCRAGLAINPETPLHTAEQFIDQLDILLMMTVHPGFGGQKLISEVLPKITTARKLITQQTRKIHLSVDGGLHIDNIKPVAQAGADTFVTGSAIFKSANYQATITAMRRQLEQ